MQSQCAQVAQLVARWFETVGPWFESLHRQSFFMSFHQGRLINQFCPL